MQKDSITVASVQFDPQIQKTEYNLGKMENLTIRAVEERDAELVLFPEAAVTGYCFESPEEAWEVAIKEDGSEIERLRALAENKQVSLVFGAVEKEGRAIYNTVFFIEPDGTVMKYRKSHLPFLGVDRFVIPGKLPAAIFDTRFGKIGVIVCYELRFPETARLAALGGARLILQPTNLPLGGESHPDFLTRARACENRVHFVSCNRCGTERGFSFIGRSQIVDCDGTILAESGSEEELISVTLDLTRSQNKDIISAPGERELYLFQDRRWDLYNGLAQKPNQDGYV